MAESEPTQLATITTSLGDDVFTLAKVSGVERLSNLFEFEITLLSANHDVVFDEMVGLNVSIAMTLPGGTTRLINGFVNNFTSSWEESGEGDSDYHSQYKATLVPELWLLTRSRNSRIFQEMSTPEIVEQVLSESQLVNFRFELRPSSSDSEAKYDYPTHGYCVQYGEIDFDFISRLLEQEGIYYYFEHTEYSHHGSRRRQHGASIVSRRRGRNSTHDPARNSKSSIFPDGLQFRASQPRPRNKYGWRGRHANRADTSRAVRLSSRLSGAGRWRTLEQATDGGRRGQSYEDHRSQ
jgi:Rhs element Vgr protein